MTDRLDAQASDVLDALERYLVASADANIDRQRYAPYEWQTARYRYDDAKDEARADFTKALLALVNEQGSR